MLNVLFFVSIACFFVTSFLHVAGGFFKKEGLQKAGWLALIVSTLILSVYLVARGISAGRIPMSNQFEFATFFAWGIAVMTLILHYRMKVEGIAPFAIPGVFVLLSYAALLPKDITELMPALKSAWFVSHISSAILSYSAFAIACFLGIRYLTMLRRGASPEDKAMQDLDYLSYRMIAFGFIFLTLVILTGCIWAEQAWSTFWSWDPKETWALITWIIYAIYLHLRINRKYRGKKMAVYVIVAMICVIFTFVGVNQLMPGLHSYG